MDNISSHVHTTTPTTYYTTKQFQLQAARSIHIFTIPTSAKPLTPHHRIYDPVTR
ncbi:hypothetical protein M404DRAFT_999215 [Pisolithus tinctorius Marx 270]|uniref:Uncharacterized protein n=1 Tax=Pisolithus tinctorius Marx 270 TaxID=870435 RepID=A0A0C3NYU3_PISTI|nr:hypothetical protein M404DRAFT_999215 [Pisolithus tinctorius Marx 270]